MGAAPSSCSTDAGSPYHLAPMVAATTFTKILTTARHYSSVHSLFRRRSSVVVPLLLWWVHAAPARRLLPQAGRPRLTLRRRRASAGAPRRRPGPRPPPVLHQRGRAGRAAA